jgi:hypothetical protein
MKIFNVNVRVTMTLVADIPDNPEPAPAPVKEKFNDDPLDKTEKVMNKYLDRVERMNRGPRHHRRGFPTFPGMPGGEPEGASLSKNVAVTAENYRDLNAILEQFAAVAESLPAVPDSVMPSDEGTSAPPAVWG